MTPLPAPLLARIAQRARDPDARNDRPPSARGEAVRAGPVSVMPVSLDGAPPRAAAGALAPPASDEAWADAQRRLGGAVPLPVQQLYAVADGGFGPSAGLLPLQEVVDTCLRLRAHPPGRRGQPWPAELLPLTAEAPGHVCVDLRTGAVVFWDEEELAAGASDKVWKRSFKPQAPDVASWMERWLASPSPRQRTHDLMQQGMRDAIQASLEYWRSKTPQERAAFGLPEQGWEEALLGAFRTGPGPR